ncbi:MAG: NUDIX domain-containing protein [Candidatus Dojkabacteria bacterium]|nr:NUDIX domain-containing protein [Candidatus Dojkabacteria bacterium]
MKIKLRVRLIIPFKNKLLLVEDTKNKFWFYPGGKVEYGESIERAIKREIVEELGEDREFKMDKILFIRDFILPEKNEHSLELFILGKLNNYDDLEERTDPEYNNEHIFRFINIEELPVELYPQDLTKRIVEGFKNGFEGIKGEYVGNLS